jgi:uncharacterized membrane protein YeiB
MFYHAKHVRFIAGSRRSVAGRMSACNYLCESVCSSFHARGSGEFCDYVCLFMFYHAKHVRFIAGSRRLVAGRTSACNYLCESVCSSFHARGSGEFCDYVCLFMFYYAKHVRFIAGSRRSVAGRMSACNYLCESVCSSFHV